MFVAEGRRWRFEAVGVGIALILVTLGSSGCALPTSQDDEPEQSIAVPGNGRFAIDETGEFRILYQSRDYLETGVCHTERRSGTDSHNRLVTICDNDTLAAAGEPVLRPVGSDPVALRQSNSYTRCCGPVEVSVWRGVLDRTGEYELEFESAPLGTDRLIVRVGAIDTGTSGSLLVPIAIAVTAVVVIIIAIIAITVVRSQRPGRGSSGPPLTPPGIIAR